MTTTKKREGECWACKRVRPIMAKDLCSSCYQSQRKRKKKAKARASGQYEERPHGRRVIYKQPSPSPADEDGQGANRRYWSAERLIAALGGGPTWKGPVPTGEPSGECWLFPAWARGVEERGR